MAGPDRGPKKVIYVPRHESFYSAVLFDSVPQSASIRFHGLLRFG